MTTDLLKELLSFCKCSVTVQVNEHRDVYYSVEKYLAEALEVSGNKELADKEVVLEMIKRDMIIDVQAYPATPVGSFHVYHYDLDMALTEMIDLIKDNYKQD